MHVLERVVKRQDDQMLPHAGGNVGGKIVLQRLNSFDLQQTF